MNSVLQPAERRGGGRAEGAVLQMGQQGRGVLIEKAHDWKSGILGRSHCSATY